MENRLNKFEVKSHDDYKRGTQYTGRKFKENNEKPCQNLARRLRPVYLESRATSFI